MPSVGETLRRERIKRNLDLEHISRETKISSRFLNAIESEQFDKLPGGVFARSFVRQYARLLELDEEELVNSLEQMLEPAPEPAPSPEPKAKREPPVEPKIVLPKVEDWQSAGDSRFQFSSWLPALAGVVLVMLACSLVYAWWQRSRQSPAENPVAAAAPPPTAAPQQPAPTPPPAAAPDTTAPTTPENKPASPTAENPVTPAAAAPAATTPAVQRTTPLTPPNPNASVRVLITANEATWMLVRTDGKYLFSGTLDANESRTIESNGTVLLRLGNAGGVSVSYNGKDLGAPGPKGQVRTLQFTSGGFQIVSGAPVAAPKPPAPLDPL
jgi:cytoskeleton protein RodZ